MERQIKLSEISKLIDLKFEGPDAIINGLNLCNRVTIYDSIITYVTSKSYISHAVNNKSVKAIFLSLDMYEENKHLFNSQTAFFITNNPEVEFYNLHKKLYDDTNFYHKYSFSSKIGQNSYIHSSAVIEEGVIIGDNVIIGANTVIKKGTVIENNVTIGCNNVIGGEGFQPIKFLDGNYYLIRHVGGVLIRNNVNIAECGVIENSLFEGNTYIGKYVKIDNLVCIGHNSIIGDNSVITAGCILCGSAIIENNAWIGVNSSILNRVTVGENALIGIMSAVTRDVKKNSLAYGVPAKEKIRG